MVNQPLKLKMKVDILEIGTSDFGTLAGKANGLFVEPVREYFERLDNCLKERVAISDREGEISIYFIPSKEIERLGLPNWVRGCNSVNEPHKTIVANGWGSHIVSEVVRVIRVKTLLESHSIDDVEFLKIDTEGHDCVILNDFLDTCNIKPRKIQFEDNALSPLEDRVRMKQRLISLGYKIEARVRDIICTLETRTAVCVLRNGGPLYTSDWVLKLRDSIKRNTPTSHRFVCLSDKDIPTVDTVKLNHLDLRRGWVGWWSKIELFRPELFTGPTVYFDLDTIILKDITPLFLCCENFSMLSSHLRLADCWGSGVMAWDGDFSFIYEKFIKDPIAWMDKFKSMPRIGDQALISEFLVESGTRPTTFNERLGYTALASYKRHNCSDKPPKDALAVYFHGRDKPHSVESGWVKEIWDSKKP